MERLPLLFLVVFWAASYTALSITDGLLPNGDFEIRPQPAAMKGSVVTGRNAIPHWEFSGIIEYIKSGQKQDDMILVVPEGNYAVRLGNEAYIKQKLKLTKGMLYSVTFSAARTCTQDEKLNVSLNPATNKKGWAILPIQTMYSNHGWDLYSCGFEAEFSEVELVIHNTGMVEDAACGPLIDTVAVKTLNPQKRTRENWIENGDFEEGPYIFDKMSGGVLLPPHVEDDQSPLPGWIVESLKAVKYLDSTHFRVPSGKRAIELVGGKESAIAQIVPTIPGKVYVLTFAVGDANNECEGLLAVEAFAGKDTVKVPYQSKGKGGFLHAKLEFKAVSPTTRIVFLSTFYFMTSDHTGSLCGPVVDDVKLVSVRFPKHV